MGKVKTSYKVNMLEETKVPSGGKSVITPTENTQGLWAGESKGEEKKGGENRKTKP